MDPLFPNSSPPLSVVCMQIIQQPSGPFFTTCPAFLLNSFQVKTQPLQTCQPPQVDPSISKVTSCFGGIFHWKELELSCTTDTQWA